MYDVDWPCEFGIVVVPGAGQVLAVVFVQLSNKIIKPRLYTIASARLRCRKGQRRRASLTRRQGCCSGLYDAPIQTAHITSDPWGGASELWGKPNHAIVDPSDRGASRGNI